VALLSRHKHALHWLHIGLVLAVLLIVAPWLSRIGSGAALLWLFVVATVAWCQNIGLLHHFAHHLPYGPRWLGSAVASALHGLGGLGYTRARLAHRLHHAYLGTERDPDRLGYQATATFAGRLRHLFLIGPLRGRFAPVDIGEALQAMSATRRARFETQCRRDRVAIVLAHGVLLLLCGAGYAVVLAALLFANVLSNAREMAEHGDRGRVAYVDIRVSPLGLLLFSTPGFWFHGRHHLDAKRHYLDLPSHAGGFTEAANLPQLQRRGVVRYLLTGT